MSFVIYNFITYTFIHGIYKVNKNDANNEFVRMRSCFFQMKYLQVQLLLTITQSN